MTKPITPQEVKSAALPDEVIEVFNELIQKFWDDGQAVFTQSEAASLISDRMGVPQRELFERHYLDVEATYRGAGWIVEHDEPGHNEVQYLAFFTFKKPPAELGVALADIPIITEDTNILFRKEQACTTVQMTDLGKVLLRERTGRALTLRELGGQIGVSASTLSRIENNAASPPSVPVLKAISRWLDLSIEIDGVVDQADPYREDCQGMGEYDPIDTNQIPDGLVEGWVTFGGRAGKGAE